MSRAVAVPLSFALALAALPTQAQTGPDNRPIEEMVVLGTRLPTPIDRVGRSVSVLTAPQIELRQQRFLYDALQALPGVQLIRSGSFGALASVSIRGLPSDQTLVVQDGVVLNNPAAFGTSFNFANFGTADVERIEVLRGAQSTLYGSDAIGGVINIVTKDGRDGFAADGFVEGGSFGTFRGAAGLAGGSDTVSGRVTLSGVRTRGFSTADAANGNTEDDGFENFTASAKGRFAPREDLRFEAVVRYQDSENEFDGFAFPAGPVDADEVGDTEELTVAGFATHDSFGGALENRLSVTWATTEQLNLSDGAPSFDARGARVSYQYDGTLRAHEKATLLAGVEYEEQTSEVTVGFGGNQTIETISGYGLFQLEPVDFATLNLGVRHDSSSDFGSETTVSVSGALEHPRFGTVLRGSYGEGFRGPSAGELSFNPDLFAEVSDGWDLGVEQPLWRDRARLSATYFDQRITDRIAFDLADFTFVNIQEFAAEGVEIALDATPRDWLAVNAAYTYTDATNVSTSIAAGNQPDHRISVDVAVRPTDRLSLSLNVAWNGRESSGGTTLDGFTLVNLRGSYAVCDGIEIFARVENLTDADYQDNLGFGTAPISAFGGVRARF